MMATDDTGKSGDVLASIMGAAIKNFAEKGYEGARVDEIAHDAGVNKATIYYHIGDKEALYKAVLTRVLSSGADRMVERVAAATDPGEKITAYVDTIIHHVLAGREDFSRIMMREMAGGGANIPQDVLETIMKKILGTAFDIINDGVGSGQLSPVNPTLMHMMIVGSVAFFRSTEQLRKKGKAPGLELNPLVAREMESGLAEQISRILLHGLLPRDRETT